MTALSEIETALSEIETAFSEIDTALSEIKTTPAENQDCVIVSMNLDFRQCGLDLCQGQS